jgi:hypothetical protein
MEQQLLELSGPPDEESATLRRVVQAKRHELWRVSHPYRRNLALRIVCFFPDVDTVVLALMGFNKHPVGDTWYGRAATEGQAMVDQYMRQQGGGGTR